MVDFAPVDADGLAGLGRAAMILAAAIKDGAWHRLSLLSLPPTRPRAALARLQPTRSLPRARTSTMQ